MNDLRHEIVDILGQPEIDTAARADLILSAMADWLGSPVGYGLRLSLALDAAAPGVFGHGVWADAGLTDAALAVARELAAAIRPPAPRGQRPLADRYAELPSEGPS
ncbi:hypothetical protein [Salinispora sp. H7-4]|uniref:hypothetical protein n=1 Tax=Salinispora sp. H7-4 TaxID=2748321 RepID=UPI0015D1D0E7|nr:hypothetical protein [Salinispora sp. H7-4]NYT96302.1 hypothetical protein [Salinispora sp. H7-4]